MLFRSFVQRGKTATYYIHAFACGTTQRYHHPQSAIPLKIRIFLCQPIRKRLPSNYTTRHRQGPSNGWCSLCGQREDVDHILFTCSLTRFMWSAVRELLQCNWNPSCLPTSIEAFSCVSHSKRVFLYAAQPFVGPCGTSGTSSPLRDEFRHIRLMDSTNCRFSCRFGGLWLGDRTRKLWS